MAICVECIYAFRSVKGRQPEVCPTAARTLFINILGVGMHQIDWRSSNGVKQITIDSAELEQLNGASDREGILHRGRLIIPGRHGEMISLDLGGPFRPRDLLLREYWQAHPRFMFFKTVVENARLIDVGAGSGAMIGWKVWGSPDRRDIAMSAVDMFKGEFFDEYVDFDVVKLGANRTKFQAETFDAAIVSHLIEHVSNRDALAEEIFRLCKPGAKIYVEWPTYHSGTVVSKKVLETFGVRCSTINFFDDGTHLNLVTRTQGVDSFTKVGFSVLSSGEIVNDYLFPELFRCGFIESNSEATTYALWLALRFAQYVVFEKI